MWNIVCAKQGKEKIKDALLLYYSLYSPWSVCKNKLNIKPKHDSTYLKACHKTI